MVNNRKIHPRPVSNLVEFDWNRRIVKKTYFEKSSFEIERLVLEQLTHVGVNVPRIVSVHSKDDRPFLELELVSGTPAILLGHDALCLALPMMGKAVRGLHARLSSESPLLGLKSRKLEDLLLKLEILKDMVANRPIRSLFLHYKELIEPRDSDRCLVHRDIRLDNFIVDEKEMRVFIIDFERCVLGSGLSDLARFLTIELNDDLRLCSLFLDGYGMSVAQLEPTKFIYELIFAVEMLEFLLRDPARIRTSKRLVGFLKCICDRAAEL